MNSYDKKIKNRLKRLTGQAQGVSRMMDDEADCVDVVTQLSAVRSSLDKLISLIVAENLKSCLIESQNEADQEAKIQQAMELLTRR